MKKGLSDAQKRRLIKEVLRAAKDAVDSGYGEVEFIKSDDDE